MPRAHNYKGPALLMSARGQAAVTPDDDADLPGGTARALFVGTGGDLVLVLEDDADTTGVTWKNIPDGTVVDAWVRRVKEATTADDIIALY